MEIAILLQSKAHVIAEAILAYVAFKHIYL